MFVAGILLVEVILPLMLPTPVAPIESGLTVRAFIRLVSTVLVHVRPKMAFGGQLFVTNRTGIANPFVDNVSMSLKVSLAIKSRSANFAVERLIT